MEAKKYQAFWRGAIILTIASFVTKVLSAFLPYSISKYSGGILGFIFTNKFTRFMDFV